MDPFATPRSAYVHVPFCAHRCGYCNFSVVAGRDDLAGRYLTAVAKEADTLPGPHAIDTLYFGGGTPTRLADGAFARLAEAVLRRRPLSPGAEWTVEANPAELSTERIGRLAALGVTRLSLGAQSLRDAKLRALERDHTGADVRRCVVAALERGLRVSVDLIFAAPGETLVEWLEDVRGVIELTPHHVSVYGLTYERGTRFWSRRLRGELTELEDGPQRAMYEGAIDTLGASGLAHYEVSNFALPGHESRHNLVYWAGGSYDALGPGAARYVGGVRETNHRSTTTYLRRIEAGQSPVAERESLNAEQRARERLVFGLRRLAGWSRREFALATGFEIEGLAGAAVQKFAELGLLDVNPEHVRLTREGLLLSDSLWPEML